MGAKRGGGQIIYGLDVGKGEMRFCGFLGLDTFHTEIVWCEAPFANQRSTTTTSTSKKATQRSKEAKNLVSPHNTPHTTHHTRATTTQVEMQKL